jgi:hypothetical protein
MLTARIDAIALNINTLSDEHSPRKPSEASDAGHGKGRSVDGTTTRENHNPNLSETLARANAGNERGKQENVSIPKTWRKESD